jgi:putative transposase
MNQLINFTKGDSIFIAEREHEFFNFVQCAGGDKSAPDDLQFRDTLNHRVQVLTRKEFDDFYLAGKLRWKSPIERKGDQIPEEYCDDGELRTIRQKFTKTFDAKPVAKTDAALKVLYGEVLQSLNYSEDDWGRSGGTLRRWVNGRGEPGNRPRKCMGDRRRRGAQASLMNAKALEILQRMAERYWDNQRVTARDIYADVRTALIPINAERKEKNVPLIKVPGRTSVWRYLTSHSDFDNSRRRFGARMAQRLFTPLKGSLQAKRILDVAIMDHTVLDCFVVDDENFIPVGRPYLTLLIDVRSRYPLAFVLGYTPPSVETAMACLRRAVRPKTDIKSRFPEIQGEWVAFGVPRTVLVDNGWEFCGGSFRDACEDAGISVEWAPVRTPEYKGICERYFRTLNQYLVHKLKGSVPFKPHLLSEFGIDPTADAVLLLSEIEELICQTIIEVYGREPHQGIKAVPEQVWRTRQEIDGIDYAADLRALDHSFSKLGGERTLTRSGIEFKELTYRSEDVFGLLNELLPREHKRGSSRGTVKVKFKYWPEDLSKIAVWSSVRQAYVELPCTEAAYSKGLTEHHHDVLRRYAQDQSLKFSTEDERCAARARLNERVASFVNNRNIGSRRRAQRFLASPKYIENPPETPIGTSDATEPLDDNINPIETVSNRIAGAQPVRGPVRSRRRPAKRPSVKRKAAIAGSDSVLVTNRVAPISLPDPFASFDRNSLLQTTKNEVLSQ